jgi:hypothetical protein
LIAINPTGLENAQRQYGGVDLRGMLPPTLEKLGQPMSHKFTVGQAVALAPGVLRYAAAGEYEIRCLVPAPDNDPRDPRYRIKHISEKHERVACESELTLSRQADPAFS